MFLCVCVFFNIAPPAKEETTKAIPKPGRFNKNLGKTANKNQSKTSLANSIRSHKGSTTVLSKKTVSMSLKFLFFF